MKANLSDASLWEVDLSSANLQGAILKDAWLAQANLSGTRFSLSGGSYPAEGLTQSQIDTAHSYKNNLPKLDGVLDADTGQQLNPPTTEPDFWEKITEFVEESRQDQPKPQHEES